MPYRHAYEHIPAQVWTAAPDGMLDYVNPEAVAYMGVLEADLLGTGGGMISSRRRQATTVRPALRAPA